jgi:hypothetical protein
MFVAINFNQKLKVSRDEIADIVLDALMDQGKDRAKVTGGGSGVGGGTIDLEVDDTFGVDEILSRLRQALQASEDVPRDTEIQIESEFFPLYPTTRKGQREMSGLRH